MDPANNLQSDSTSEITKNSAALDHRQSISDSSYPRRPGETPRAFGAFTAYFQLGNNRSLQAVADKLGEHLQTVKNWSSKFDWNERIHQFNLGLLQKQIDAQTEAHRKAAADWEKRTAEFREQEWIAAQKLLNVVNSCLDNFGSDRDLERMRLSELSRALNIATKMSRSALQSPDAPGDKPSLAPIQMELLAALDKIQVPETVPVVVANHQN